MHSTNNLGKEHTTVKWHLGIGRSSATDSTILDVSQNQVFGQGYQIMNQKRVHCKVSHCGLCGKAFSQSLFNRGSEPLSPCEKHCEQCRKSLPSGKCQSQMQQNPFPQVNVSHHPHHTNNHHDLNSSPKTESPCSSSGSSSSSSSNEDPDEDEMKNCQPSSSATSNLNSTGLSNNRHGGNSSSSNPAMAQSSRPEKTFQCDICGRAFTLVGNMQKHRKLHSGERPFSCDVCGKAFGLRGNLQKHKIIHTGEKLFHCKVCNKPFALRGNMQKHEIIHTGMKPFHCEVCGKCFTLRGNLQKHLVTHSGSSGDKKHFRCDLCGKNFSQNNCLQNHIQRFHCQIPEHNACSDLRPDVSDLSGPDSENEIHPFHHQHH